MAQVMIRLIEETITHYTVASHAAFAGADYDAITTNGTFLNGSMAGDMECVSVTITDDSALELDETFTVILTTSEPAVTLSNDTATITITDNDGLFHDNYDYNRECNHFVVFMIRCDCDGTSHGACL